jgi:hypothetical protein
MEAGKNIHGKDGKKMKKTTVRLLVFLFAAWFVLSCSCSLPLAAAATDTPVPPKATNTPIPATPTGTPIPGWKKFEAEGVEIWLPESFEGGNPSEDLDMIVDRLNSLGPEFETMAQTIEQNPDAFVFWAFDSDIGESGILTNVNIVTQRVVSAITVETYLDMTAQQLPSQFRVVERGMVDLEYYTAGRIVVEATILSAEVKEVMYLIKHGKSMWGVTYSTGAVEFDARLPMFEQSINTLVIKSEE